MKKIKITSEVDYKKIPNPLQKNAFRIYRSTKIEDRRRKKPKYKTWEKDYDY